MINKQVCKVPMQAYFYDSRVRIPSSQESWYSSVPKAITLTRSASTKDAEFSKMILYADPNKFAIENIC